MANPISFDPDTADYMGHVDDLRAQLQTAREAWLADRDDLDVADRHQHAMNQYDAARRHLRLVGIAAGTRTTGLGIDATNNTEGA